MSPKKVLLAEFNEINWGVIDQLVRERGEAFLPNFARLRREGACGAPEAIEVSPHLDPWITWVTLHTGVPREVHGASVLEQDSSTLKAKRLWHYVAEAGRKVGIFGSISAYPPQPVDGFMVPGPFAPSDDTYPPTLQAVQAVNRLGTQLHNKTVAKPSLGGLAGMAVQLVRWGLRPATVASVAVQLVRERVQAGSHWRRVTLQPVMNMDFFSRLYRSHRPDFATWHSNHAAHFMHHYWRSWDDSAFAVKATAEERAKYGEAVPEGYRICDELLGRLMQLIDGDTVLVVASSMGQQPYKSERYVAGKVVVRVRDIDRLLGVVGREGIDQVVPTMVPQWNLRVADPVARSAIRARFEAIRRTVEGRSEGAFAVEETDAILTITPLGLSGSAEGVRYSFPGCPGDRPEGFPIAELFAVDAPTVKQGMHHPRGLLCFFGRGIQPGVELAPSTNLDVAPTLLTLMGIPVPAQMTGRVLSEITGSSAAVKLNSAA